MMDCGSRRFIAPGRRWRLPATRQKLASTPTPGACSTIRRSTRPIVSSMAVMIPVPALYYSALGPNGCSAIPRRRSQASPNSLSMADDTKRSRQGAIPGPSEMVGCWVSPGVSIFQRTIAGRCATRERSRPRGARSKSFGVAWGHPRWRSSPPGVRSGGLARMANSHSIF